MSFAFFSFVVVPGRPALFLSHVARMRPAERGQEFSEQRSILAHVDARQSLFYLKRGESHLEDPSAEKTCLV